jgi:hypothetical protein
VRKQLYRSVFAGACGVTYGHHSMWQFYETWREVVNFADRTWREALDRPGASQVRYLRALMESRAYFTRIPDQGMLLTDAGQGGEHVQATRDANGSYALVYFPMSRMMSIDLSSLKGKHAVAQWYDPRTGAYTLIDEYPIAGAQSFTPPTEGPDWVLVLDAK